VIATPRAELRRALGLTAATALVAGNVIGSGIFVAPAEVARALPGIALPLLAWCFGGLLSLAGALTMSELAAADPRTGGAYVYLRRAFGPRVAFLFGWAELWVIRPTGAAGIAVVFAAHLATLVPGIPARAIAAAALVAVYALNYRSLVASSHTQTLLTLFKAAALAAIAGVALVRGGDAAGATPAAIGPAAWSVALVAILWTYDGWSEVTYVAAEVRDPRRLLPRSLVLGTLAVTALYLLVNAAVLRVLTPAERAADPAVVAQLARRLAGDTGAAFTAALVLVSTLGSLLGGAVTTPRLFFAMGRDGVFFRRLGDVHPRFGTPGPAIVLICTVAVLYVVTQSFTAIVSNFVFVMWIFYALCGVALLVLRRREPRLDRPFRTPWSPFLPLAFIAASLLMLGSMVRSAPRASLLGAVVLATGWPMSYVWSRSRKTTPARHDDAAGR
jgi:APA family basic amino acid/polyamine antiporter